MVAAKQEVKTQQEMAEQEVEGLGPRKRTWYQAVCASLRLTKEDATPPNYRVIFLVVFSLVRL